VSSFTFFFVTSHGFSYLIARQSMTRVSAALQPQTRFAALLGKASAAAAASAATACAATGLAAAARRAPRSARAHFQVRRPLIQLVLHARQSRDNAARARSKATSSSMDQHLVLMYLRRPRRENGNAVLMLMC
jgi:hypothetical protein